LEIIIFLFGLGKNHSRLDPNEWADIFAASGAKCVDSIL
jgi:hypothetical protein